MALPLDLLEKLVGQSVAVLLKDGRRLEGRLAGYDPHMNMVVEAATESGRPDAATRTLGTVLLRGNNVVSIAPNAGAAPEPSRGRVK